MADHADNNQLKATVKYFDQIQRASERLGRTRYQNINKLNNEIKLTARYFDSAYRSAIRLANLRIAPQVTLNDQASGALDKLSRRLLSVKNQMVSVFGKSSITIKQTSESSTQTPINFDGLIAALENNTKALKSNAGALLLSGNSGQSNEATKKEEPKTTKDKIKDFFGHIKSTGEGTKNLADTFTKFKEVKGLIKGKDPSNNNNNNNNNQNPPNEDRDDTSNNESPLQRKKRQRAERNDRRLKIVSGIGEMVENFGGAGSNLIEGVSGLWEDGGSAIDWVKNKISGTSAAASSSETLSAAARVGTEGAEEAGSGLLKGVLKGGAKKLLGPLSYGLDAANILQATDGRERAEAVGSMAGSTIGAGVGGTIGTAILPGIGTAAGSYIGGMVGDVVGGKIGGWVSDHKDAISEKISSFTSGIADFFSAGKKEVEAAPKITPPTVPNTVINPPLASPVVANSMNAGIPNNVVYGPNQVATNTIQPPNNTKVNQISAKANAKSNGNSDNGNTVQISDAQISTISGMLKDFKAQVTNAVSVNVPVGAVQVTVQENEIDYDALVVQIGQRVVSELRKSMQNRKSDSPQTISATPMMA